MIVLLIDLLKQYILQLGLLKKDWNYYCSNPSLDVLQIILSTIATILFAD